MKRVKFHVSRQIELTRSKRMSNGLFGFGGFRKASEVERERVGWKPTPGPVKLERLRRHQGSGGGSGLVGVAGSDEPELRKYRKQSPASPVTPEREDNVGLRVVRGRRLEVRNQPLGNQGGPLDGSTEQPPGALARFPDVSSTQPYDPVGHYDGRGVSGEGGPDGHPSSSNGSIDEETTDTQADESYFSARPNRSGAISALIDRLLPEDVSSGEEGGEDRGLGHQVSSSSKGGPRGGGNGRGVQCCACGGSVSASEGSDAEMVVQKFKICQGLYLTGENPDLRPFAVPGAPVSGVVLRGDRVWEDAVRSLCNDVTAGRPESISFKLQRAWIEGVVGRLSSGGFRSVPGGTPTVSDITHGTMSFGGCDPLPGGMEGFDGGLLLACTFGYYPGPAMGVYLPYRPAGKGSSAPTGKKGVRVVGVQCPGIGLDALERTPGGCFIVLNATSGWCCDEQYSAIHGCCAGCVKRIRRDDGYTPRMSFVARDQEMEVFTISSSDEDETQD